ncbi:MAG: hypothetical protein A4E61_00397 [Syntrophorhabdus sp. PtaB.Bin184]|nr:MAG: hypothetical protein A4E61_00397 [Syntrophorhabdus sp. PtaB.Bin184]
MQSASMALMALISFIFFMKSMFAEPSSELSPPTRSGPWGLWTMTSSRDATRFFRKSLMER